jgi:hypothetical protein
MQDVPNVPDMQDVPNVRTNIKVPDVKVMSNMQDVPGVPYMPEVPRNTAHNIFDAKSQTNEPGVQIVPNMRTSINVPDVKVVLNG